MKKKALVAVVILSALSGVMAVGTGYWWFRPVIHSEAVSTPKPCGSKWVVTVTKEMRLPLQVEVRLKIGDTLDMHLYSHDMWDDVKPGSYAVHWVSDDEFVVGGLEPEDGDWLRGRYRNHFWVIEPVGAQP